MPDSRTEAVEALPRRVAHVVHALLVVVDDLNMPARAGEVCVRDEHAPSVRSTSSALQRARARGLAVNAGQVWVPTTSAHDLSEALEARFLRDVDDL